MESSKLFRLNINDLFKGAVTAVIAGVVISLAGVVQQAGFDVFSADWGAILSSAVSAGVAAFVGYVGKNFVSDSEGKVFGRIG